MSIARIAPARVLTVGALSCLLGLLALNACDPPTTQPHPTPSAETTARTLANVTSSATSSSAGHADSTHTPAAAEPAGDVERGRKLAGQFECNRCHDGLDIKPIAMESHCVQCHQEVMNGRFSQKPDNARWQKNVAHLTAVPSLDAAGKRLDYGWVVSFLMEPHDLRPNLEPSMPRLALTREQARDLASYVTRETAPAGPALAGADAAAGRKQFEDKGCLSCHSFSGTGLVANTGKGEGRETRAAVMLAPDLRYARERLNPATVVTWLLDPLAMKKNTLMPKTPMSEQEARDIAGFILSAKLEPVKAVAFPSEAKPLDRKVTYDEVASKVLNVTCRHCHGDPDVAIGDGGPGNTGGFGFKRRGLNLTSYEYTQAGYLDDAGERHSVFTPMKDGTPRLVAAMLARHAEIAGKPNPEIRGMPLGLPPVPIEDIRLLATWIEQGRPR